MTTTRPLCFCPAFPTSPGQLALSCAALLLGAFWMVCSLPVASAATVAHLRFEGMADGTMPTGAVNEFADVMGTHGGTFLGELASSNWTSTVPALTVYDPIADVTLNNAGAFQFGNDSRINLSASTLLPTANSSNAFTFEAFIFADPRGASGQIFEHRSNTLISGPEVFHFSENSAPNAMQLRTSYDAGTQTFGNAAAVVPDSLWHHVATVWDPGTSLYTAYFDGEEVGSIEVTDTWSDGEFDGEFTIGKFVASSFNFNDFQGIMDEIRISNVALSPNQFLQASLFRPTDIEWTQNNNGLWQIETNWSAGGPPSLNTQTAIFGNVLTSPATILTNEPVTMKAIRFDSSASYAISGHGTVVLDADTGNASIEVMGGANAGDHQFQVQVRLEDDTDVTVATGASLSFNNVVDLNGHTLSVVSGEVNLNNKVISGSAPGAIVNAGILAGGGSIAGDLTNLSSGTLVADLRGPGALDISGLTVSGTADLSGVLDVTGGFVPTSGSYEVLTAGSIVNNGLTLSPAAAALFELVFTPNSLLLTVAAPGISGDYNNDGMVDAADYTVWRNNLGSSTVLANDDTPGSVTAEDYVVWKANFGLSAGASLSSTFSAVPEPPSAWMAIGIFALAAIRFRVRK